MRCSQHHVRGDFTAADGLVLKKLDERWYLCGPEASLDSWISTCHSATVASSCFGCICVCVVILLLLSGILDFFLDYFLGKNVCFFGL